MNPNNHHHPYCKCAVLWPWCICFLPKYHILDTYNFQEKVLFDIKISELLFFLSFIEMRSKILPNSIYKISITIIFAPFSWVSVGMHTDKIPSRIAMAVHIADINSVAEVCVFQRCLCKRRRFGLLIRSLSSLPFSCGHEETIRISRIPI